MDTEAGSLPGLAIDLDAAAMSGDDAMRDRQAQPGAFAHGFGGEERIEKPGQNLGFNAAAIIRDFDEQLVADALASNTNAPVRLARGGFDSMQGIDQEIEQHLADLGGHAVYLGAVAAVEFHLDLPAPELTSDHLQTH